MAEMDVDFEWPIDDEGYQIHRLPAVTTGALVSRRGEQDVIVRKGGPLRKDRPIAFHPTLFRQFAELEKPEECLKFAEKFGYLGLGAWFGPKDTYEDGAGSQGEAVQDWLDAALNMYRAIEVSKSDPQRLASGATKISNLDAFLVADAADR